MVKRGKTCFTDQLSGYDLLAAAVINQVISDYTIGRITEVSMISFFKKSFWLDFFELDRDACIKAILEKKHGKEKKTKK